MKKIGLGLGALIVAATVYYFTIGSGQIIEEIKSQVNTQLTTLETEGFTIEDRKVEEKKEHFVITFADTNKISSFLFRQGMQINAEDAKALKGLKIGVDTHYLPDAYSSVAFDMYPVALPEVLISSRPEDKEVLADIKKMLKKKTFLVHVAIKKTGNAFKGHLNDINETMNEHDQAIELQLQSFKFAGDLKENSIHSIKQTLDNFSIFSKDEIKVALTNIASKYEVTGNTLYDYKTHYSVENIVIGIESNLDVTIKDVHVLSRSSVQNDIASGSIKTTVGHTHIADEKEPYNLENFVFEMKASNIDITAMEKLQKADLADEKVMNEILKQMFSKGVHFAISTLSLESIESDGQKIDGFDLNAQITLSKNFDLLSLEKNPLSALETVNADLKLLFSKELFELVSEQPQAMMALMMFQPKDENDKKVYKLQLKDGKFTVNDKPMM